MQTGPTVRATGTVLALLIATGGLAACGEAEESAAAGAAKPTAQAGCDALRKEYPGLAGKNFKVSSAPGPGNYNNPNPQEPTNVQGLEPDILRAAAACLDFEVAYMPQSFDGLIPSIKSGRTQIISSGMYATPERAKQVSFVTHLTAATAAVLANGNPKGIKSLDDTCGKKQAAVTGTVENEIQGKQNTACEAAGKKPAEAATYATNDQAVNAVRQGRSDYFLTDAGVAAQVAQKFDNELDAGFAVPSDFSFGFGVDPKNTELIKGLHAALMLAYENGSLETTQKKWGFAAEQKLKPEMVTG